MVLLALADYADDNGHCFASAKKLAQKGDRIAFPSYRNDEVMLVKYLKPPRNENKKEFYSEKSSQPILFGWQCISDNLREITLTEGELDTMSLSQYGIPALSLPFGGGTGNKHAWIDLEYDRLAIYDKIYLCFDNDEVGRKTVDVVAERLGRHRCYVVTLPEKDANACLQKGISEETIKACFQKAKTHDPKELRSAYDYMVNVLELFYPEDDSMMGYQTPWQKCQDSIMFRPNELSIWTGINGHGKSQFLGYLSLHFMQQGARVCIASLEMKPERLLARLVRQCAAAEIPNENNIVKIHDWFRDKLWLFDLVGTAKTVRLLEVFQYARQRYGIDVFIIDSLLKCNLADDDYNAQKQFLEQLCDFKNEHACHIHVVAHPRKGVDENNIPGKLDIKGTGSISDLADNCFTIWRNKEKEGNEPDCTWSCHKQRNGDWEGKFALWFDPISFQYHETNKLNSKPLLPEIISTG